MVLHNPNNWHWVNKDASPWAKDYLETHVKEAAAEEDGVSAKITKLISMDGDVEVSQRKGKVITIFDVSLQLEYEGTALQPIDTYKRDGSCLCRKDTRRHRCQRKHKSTRVRIRH